MSALRREVVALPFRRTDACARQQANAYAMIQRRARAVGIRTRIGNHTFRATGITHLKNGGTLEKPR